MSLYLDEHEATSAQRDRPLSVEQDDEALEDERAAMRRSLRASYHDLDAALSPVEADIERIVEELDAHEAATLQARLEMATARLMGRALS